MTRRPLAIASILFACACGDPDPVTPPPPPPPSGDEEPEQPPPPPSALERLRPRIEELSARTPRSSVIAHLGLTAADWAEARDANVIELRANLEDARVVARFVPAEPEPLLTLVELRNLDGEVVAHSRIGVTLEWPAEDAQIHRGQDLRFHFTTSGPSWGEVQVCRDPDCDDVVLRDRSEGNLDAPDTLEGGELWWSVKVLDTESVRQRFFLGPVGPAFAPLAETVPVGVGAMLGRPVSLRMRPGGPRWTARVAECAIPDDADASVRAMAIRGGCGVIVLESNAGHRHAVLAGGGVPTEVRLTKIRHEGRELLLVAETRRHEEHLLTRSAHLFGDDGEGPRQVWSRVFFECRVGDGCPARPRFRESGRFRDANDDGVADFFFSWRGSDGGGGSTHAGRRDGGFELGPGLIPAAFRRPDEAALTPSE